MFFWIFVPCSLFYTELSTSSALKTETARFSETLTSTDETERPKNQEQPHHSSFWLRAEAQVLILLRS
jgi:hypothetical protein